MKSGGRVEARDLFDPLADNGRDLRRDRNVQLILSDIEISLIERQRFDQVCVLGEHLADLRGNSPVDVKSWRNEDEFRTAPPGCDGGEG